MIPCGTIMRRMLGDLLRAYRKALGMTQADLADAVGCTRPFIGLLEQGRRGPDDETLKALVKALDLEDSPAERKRLMDAGNAARADQDSDLKGVMAELREEVRLNRKTRRELADLLVKLRDTVLKAGVELPQDLLDRIETAARDARG